MQLALISGATNLAIGPTWLTQLRIKHEVKVVGSCMITNYSSKWRACGRHGVPTVEFDKKCDNVTYLRGAHAVVVGGPFRQPRGQY